MAFKSFMKKLNKLTKKVENANSSLNRFNSSANRLKSATKRLKNTINIPKKGKDKKVPTSSGGATS